MRRCLNDDQTDRKPGDGITSASMNRFRIERVGGNGHERLIELNATDENDAIKRTAALHSHERGPATYSVKRI